MRKALTTLAMVLLVAGCGDECSSYSEFSCKQIDSASYNTYFYYPSGTEEYLGVSNGLAECGSRARGFANEHRLSSNSDWSYVCCMKAKGSECYEKHR